MALTIGPAVRDALASGGSVVALESAVITHGLPRPAALEAVRRQWEACEKASTTPAVVAVFDGQLRVGLRLDECAVLAAPARLDRRLSGRAVRRWRKQLSGFNLVVIPGLDAGIYGKSRGCPRIKSVG